MDSFYIFVGLANIPQKLKHQDQYFSPLIHSFFPKNSVIFETSTMEDDDAGLPRFKQKIPDFFHTKT